MAQTQIFVSCGQRTAEERALGEAIRAAVTATSGYEAYFAQAVQSLEALGNHVLDALQQCSGAVVVFHRRGELTSSPGAYGSSTWVNQELAILAFRQRSTQRQIPLLCFKEEGVMLDGAMTALILNPHVFTCHNDVLPRLAKWLEHESFHSGAAEAFSDKWDRLSDNGRLAIAVLIEEGGTAVGRFALQRGLERRGVPVNDVGTVLNRALHDFDNTDLVKATQGGVTWEYSVHPTWEQPLKRACRLWLNRRNLGRREGPET